jgi:hypothetical protein
LAGWDSYQLFAPLRSRKHLRQAILPQQFLMKLRACFALLLIVKSTQALNIATIDEPANLGHFKYCEN